MRLRVLRVTPADVKACAAIGGSHASTARPHALCVRRGACCPARVGFRAPAAVSPPAGEPFPQEWVRTSDQLQNTAKREQTTPASPGPEVAEMSYDGVGLRAVKRSVVFLTAGALAVPLLTGCGSDDEAGSPLAGQDIAPATRDKVADGGTLRWAVDEVPETLNAFQADAGPGTNRVAQAVLPSMFRLDVNGRPVRNPDFLESAKVIETEPRQVVLYKLNQQAVWSDGREIGAADFAAQWRALSGKD